MSRSGYSDDCDDNWQMIMWRGRVASSIRGKRGQKLLAELAEAMDSMPEKKLIKHELKCETGYCALGVVGAKRGISLDDLDPEDPDGVADAFDIAAPLAREIVFENDEQCSYMTPEERWKYMRTWVEQRLKRSS